MITQIHHKKNELFEVEFYKDKECTETFDFTGKKNLYIELINGDITPLIALDKITPTDRSLGITAYVPYIPNVKIITNNLRIKTLDDITPNLSKYIPEDNAVLFLSGEKLSLVDYDDYYNMFSGYRDIEFEGKIIEGMPYHPQIYGIHTIGDRVSVHKHEHDIDDYTNFTLNILKGNKITIFLSYGIESELQKAVEVKKELKEKYGVEEVNLCVLHWFAKEIYELKQNKNGSYTSARKYDFNEIITTNSTGILKAKDFRKRLQVIDCKEIFEEYLKENNL